MSPCLPARLSPPVPAETVEDHRKKNILIPKCGKPSIVRISPFAGMQHHCFNHGKLLARLSLKY